jgi:hypothetical protein
VRAEQRARLGPELPAERAVPVMSDPLVVPARELAREPVHV